MVIMDFRDCYGLDPEGTWHAPGRVNLIGEHTDDNDGLVLPFAVAQGVTVAAARRDDGVLAFRSPRSADAAEITDPRPGEVTGWAAYAAGVVWALRAAGHEVGGASVLADSDLPHGAGPSPAALECAVAVALCDLYGLDVSRAELARIAQRAENDFVGIPCGVLDRAASLMCTGGHALLLDCRSGLSTQVPLDLTGLTILVIDTRAGHEPLDGGYAARRAACQKAAELLGVAALRDVEDLSAALDRLGDPVLRRRTRHVVTENHRVQAAVGLLRAGAATEVGALLTASHLSLRDQFEVSWPEADVAVEKAVRAGARGARMAGDGFGGSVIALVPTDRAEGVREAVRAAYAERGWAEPGFLDAAPSPGARRL